jgi:DNA mismatch repair ATPase MutS
LLGWWLAVLAYAAFWFMHIKRVARVVSPLQRRARELAVFDGLLRRLEREPFEASALTQLQASLRVEGQPPSECIRRLGKLAGKLRLLEDPWVRGFVWLSPQPFQVALALEAWRQKHGAHVARWLEAIACFEAISSLAAYAYENPQDPFPELVEAASCFEATALGHPLLPAARCVANDVRLAGDQQVLIVTGSNMSGKSTLLRTVAVNAVLALAGAPVRAQTLRLSPLAVGASIRVQDALAAGESRFLVEIRRLRQLVDQARGPLPLLFLVDEILQGTNPADRKEGAERVLLGLVELGALGLVTTHDLPLTEMAARPAHRMANVHFSDSLNDGRLRFDFRMRPGVVPHSNALALMHQIGLP